MLITLVVYVIMGIAVCAMCILFGAEGDWKNFKGYFSHWRNCVDALVTIAVWPIVLLFIPRAIYFYNLERKFSEEGDLG